MFWVLEGARAFTLSPSLLSFLKQESTCELNPDRFASPQHANYRLTSYPRFNVEKLKQSTIRSSKKKTMNYLADRVVERTIQRNRRY